MKNISFQLFVIICIAVSVVKSDHFVIHPSPLFVGHHHHQQEPSYNLAYSYANHHQEVSLAKPVIQGNPTLGLILQAQNLQRTAVASPADLPATSTSPELPPGYVRLAMKIDTPPGYKLFERTYY